MYIRVSIWPGKKGQQRRLCAQSLTLPQASPVSLVDRFASASQMVQGTEENENQRRKRRRKKNQSTIFSLLIVFLKGGGRERLAYLSEDLTILFGNSRRRSNYNPPFATSITPPWKQTDIAIFPFWNIRFAEWGRVAPLSVGPRASQRQWPRKKSPGLEIELPEIAAVKIAVWLNHYYH